MKTVTVALLVFSVFAPTVFAQCVEPMSLEQNQHRIRVYSTWLEVLKSAESVYKEKNGLYGNLAALRKAHLLRSLVFESGSSASARGKAQGNFVPKGTLFQVTVWADGQHFRAAIGDKCVSVVSYDPGRKGSSPPRYGLEILRDIQDGPDGPIISVAR
jgi:hypothetical protein